MRPSEFIAVEIYHRVMQFTFGALFFFLIMKHGYGYAAMLAICAAATAGIDVMSNVKRQAALHLMHGELTRRGIRIED
jgi:hypothetical protein